MSNNANFPSGKIASELAWVFFKDDFEPEEEADGEKAVEENKETAVVEVPLEVNDSTLVLRIRNTPEVKLSAIKEEVYKSDVFFIGELAFEKDPAGRVSGFTVANGRTRGIRFTKL